MASQEHTIPKNNTPIKKCVGVGCQSEVEDSVIAAYAAKPMAAVGRVAAP